MLQARNFFVLFFAFSTLHYSLSVSLFLSRSFSRATFDSKASVGSLLRSTLTSYAPSFTLREVPRWHIYGICATKRDLTDARRAAVSRRTRDGTAEIFISNDVDDI